MNSHPKAYREGWIEFYKLKFAVNPSVLIPRPETEILVETVIHHCKQSGLTNPKIVDVGTGSGCIAVTLAVNLPQSLIMATDISEDSLATAKANAAFHKVEHRITYIKTDLITGITQEPDIIVANLPYIPSSRIKTLDESVKNFEPILALDGGKDGFELYRKLFKQIKNHGWTPKLIACEIDDTHHQLALEEANKYFPHFHAKVIEDLFKRPRVLLVYP